MVLLCISPPTKEMLKQIHVSVRSKMKETNSDHDTLLLEKEAAFAVSKPLKDDDTDMLFCYVTFTSTALRKKPQESKDDMETDEAAKAGTEEKAGNGI